jgi:autotransporter-associated beta strand protein
MNRRENLKSIKPTFRNLRKNFLPLLLAMAGVLTGGSEGWATLYATYDFSSGYTNGNLVGQNSWLQVGTGSTGPIQVTNGVVKLKQTVTNTTTGGVQSAYVTTSILPVSSVTSNTSYYYVLDKLNVLSAYINSGGTSGSGIATLCSNNTASGSFARLYIKRTDLTNTSTYVYGLQVGTNAAVYGTNSFTIGSTNKIVVTYDALTSGTDSSSLFVNPIGTNRSSWTNELTVSLSGPRPSSFQSFSLQQGAQSTGTNQATMSRILIGDSVADVIIEDAPVVLVPTTVTNNSTNGTITWTSGPGWIPNNPISDTNATITFTGALGGTLTANNDSTGNFQLNSLVFSNTGSGNLNLTGNPLQFVSSGGTNPKLVFSTTAAVLQSVGNNLQIDADLTLLQASQTASNSTVAGIISGPGGISKTGTGYAYITGVNNSFGGPVKVSAGVLGATTFGMSGQASSLGTNGIIYLGDSSATSQLRATQSADQISDKTILLGGDGAFNYIENYGTAGTVLTLSGNIGTSTNGVKSLRLNPKNGPIVVSGTIGANMPANQLSLMLTNGTNQLTLTRSNAYNGGTYLQGGTLVLSNSYALGTGLVNLYGGTITALTNINLTNNFQFAAAGVTSSIAATTKVDMTNKVSGNIAGYSAGDAGVVRINTAFSTTYLANPSNTFSSVLISQGAIAADSLGVAGSPSPLGTNSVILFGNSGVGILKYLGSGETNAKTLVFSNLGTYSILEHRGTGPLKLTTPLQIDRTTTNTLILESQLTGSGELAGSVANTNIADVASFGTRLAKSGPGDWILSASNDYRNTSVQEGRLIAKHSNALPATRDVEMAGGTLLVNYSGPGGTLGNLCLTNYKSSANRYIDTAVVDPETYKFNDSTIDLGIDRSATLVFSSATNWIQNQLTNPAATNATYGRNQYLKVANSTVGGSLYITNTNGVPLSRIVCAENTNLTAKITSSGLIYFTQLNTAPNFTSGGTFNVSENSTAVATVTASDAEANPLTYTISGGADADKFWIDSGTGVLIFLSAPNFESPSDAGADNVYNLTVQVTDGALTATREIAVTVTNVSDTPADYKADWLVANGLPAGSIWSSDPNNVGYSLATSYAFGLSPSVRGGVPAALASSSAGSVKIVYLQKDNSGVTYTVKSGTDLGAGLNGSVTPVASAVQPSPGKSGYTQYEATYTSGVTRGFLKVQAVIP